MLESVIPLFQFEDGKITHLKLMPIELGIGEPRYRIGNPAFCPDRNIIQRLANMSQPYGTEITIDPDGFGIVTLP